MKRYIVRFTEKRTFEVPIIRAESKAHARALFDCGNFEPSQKQELYAAFNNDYDTDVIEIVEDEEWLKRMGKK